MLIVSDFIYFAIKFLVISKVYFCEFGTSWVFVGVKVMVSVPKWDYWISSIFKIGVMPSS